MYQLFHEFAHQYDVHTPPGHYQHDHVFVISEALRIAPKNCRLLDIGCGTGVFLEAAIAAGIDAYGLDASMEMIEVARRRLGNGRVRVQRMQEISEKHAYDVICSLSWVVHYCETEEDLGNVVRRCRLALRAGGLLILQVANDEKMTGAVNFDCESSSSGEPNDTFFFHRFRPLYDSQHRVIADYVYASRTYKELLSERHDLRFASVSLIVEALKNSEFQEICVINPASISPFVVGR